MESYGAGSIFLVKGMIVRICHEISARFNHSVKKLSIHVFLTIDRQITVRNKFSKYFFLTLH